MKNLFKYIAIYLITVVVLVLLFALVIMIPKNTIKENLNKSYSFVYNKSNYPEMIKGLKSSRRDIYADTMILNLIASQDSSKPIETLFSSKYYVMDSVNQKHSLKTVIDNDIVGNKEYLRYWHGSIVLVKPLLVIFSYQEILIFNVVILALTFIVLLYLLFKRFKYLSILTGVAFLFTYSFLVPFTLEYTWTYLIAFIISILALCIKDDSKLFILFFISGILTCFLDFLTTETLALLLPLTFVMLLKYKDKKIVNFKDGLLFVFKACLSFGIAYVFMWFTKWLLASFILNINAFDYVLREGTYRVYGSVNISFFEQLVSSVKDNFSLLLPFSLCGKYSEIVLSISVILIGSFFFLFRKEKEKLWFSKLLFLIGFIPIIRFLVLSNHSYLHSFFTYRALFPTVILWCFAFIYGIDKQLFRRKK